MAISGERAFSEKNFHQTNFSGLSTVSFMFPLLLDQSINHNFEGLVESKVKLLQWILSGLVSPIS